MTNSVNTFIENMKLNQECFAQGVKQGNKIAVSRINEAIVLLRAEIDSSGASDNIEDAIKILGLIINAGGAI